MSTFALNFRIYYEDTDAGGIVYYVNYLKFMERARTEFLRQYGYEQAKLHEQNVMFVVHSATVEYKKPAKLDDRIDVSVSLSEVKRTYLVFHQLVTLSETGECLCEAKVKVACVTFDSLKPQAIPRDLICKIA